MATSPELTGGSPFAFEDKITATYLASGLNTSAQGGLKNRRCGKIYNPLHFGCLSNTRKSFIQ